MLQYEYDSIFPATFLFCCLFFPFLSLSISFFSIYEKTQNYSMKGFPNKNKCNSFRLIGTHQLCTIHLNTAAVPIIRDKVNYIFRFCSRRFDPKKTLNLKTVSSNRIHCTLNSGLMGHIIQQFVPIKRFANYQK